MTALAADRTAPRISGRAIPDTYAGPQKGATTIFDGALCVLNAGYLAPGTTATALVAVGVRKKGKSIVSGADGTANQDGATVIEVEAGVFPFKNSTSTDTIAQADCGNDCYIVDDNTVAKTSNSSARSRAGKIVGVDSNWVYVLVGLSV